MGRSPDRLTSSYHAALTKSSSPSHQMTSSLCGDLPGIPTAMSQSFDSPGLMYATEKRDSAREKEREKVQGMCEEKYLLFLRRSLTVADRDQIQRKFCNVDRSVHFTYQQYCLLCRTI